MDILTFEKVKRQVGSNQTPREYFDFIVSGQSLRKILGIEDSDFISPFGWEINKEYDKHILNVFILEEKSQLSSGRIMIYVCPECGDIDCGAITAKLKDSGDRIVWTEFGFETEYNGLTEKYSKVNQIEFIRADYFDAFSKLII